MFVCPECGNTYEDSQMECLVGGHWTPHSADDKPKGPLPEKCCHQYQRLIKERDAV